ncbi:hypothetical protein SI65_05015 [Aspergillus cristatus]|uniref:Uncharacterized protein n=1 Tax=Aspergillus cristatus TaxID=573508 RepID=A0A1E3BGH0_ASPCR|nr:hypothetical protein SI65_05015 [Aspergillus cristatus]
MSTTTTAVSSTSTSCGWNIPVQDAACGLPSRSNNTAIMSKCCDPASVQETDSGCNYYCLAQEQSVSDLVTCFTTNGASHGEVICNAPLNATATAGMTALSTGTATLSSGSSSSSTSTATGMASTVGVSKSGLGLLAVVLGTMALGAF